MQKKVIDALMVMKTSECPVCGSDDIYTDWTLPESNQRQWRNRFYDALDVTRGRSVPLEYYICGNCGYVHSFISPEDANGIKQRWHKVGGKKRVIKRLADAAEVLGDEASVNTVAAARQSQQAEQDTIEQDAAQADQAATEATTWEAQPVIDEEPAPVESAIEPDSDDIPDEAPIEEEAAVEQIPSPPAPPPAPTPPIQKAPPPRLNDEQWEQVEELLVAAGVKLTGNKHDPRDVVDGVVYKLVTGGSWKKLPDDFPPHRSVYRTFRRWCKSGAWTLVHGYLKVQHRFSLDGDPCAE